MELSGAKAGERLLNYGQDRLVAVFDLQTDLRRAIHQLTSAGFGGLFDAQCGTVGAGLTDFTGEDHGFLGRLSHALHHMTVEGDYMHRYERELHAGHCVLTVETHGAELRTRALEILELHGGHFINHFGLWMVETVHS